MAFVHLDSTIPVLGCDRPLRFHERRRGKLDREALDPLIECFAHRKMLEANREQVQSGVSKRYDQSAIGGRE